MVRLREYGKIYDVEKKLFLTPTPGSYSNYGGIMNIQVSGADGGLSRFGIFAGNPYYFAFNLMQPGYYHWVVGAECVKKEPGWSSPNSPWNQNVPRDMPENGDVYMSLVFDGNKNEETLYINGMCQATTRIGEEYWKDFLKTLEVSKPNEICIGRGSMDSAYHKHYTAMNCYTMRIYSRALSDDEIKENYKMSVAYHNFLENNGNSK